ncbi:DEAD/DEAH box helicase [Haloechinothrix sp. LS1_15]|uniref:DEAD/DEAH box helicase n=1 Tax=Haloechinothrix sp. LS1_15 TaxID=2652248 RepID=UPI002945CB78|nr:DEAD/DEAH box helicase [Haloechinothrix sp. LS1_15]MDV6014295.1 DEAD/DEAH box helicase [Haloechinothrix sp. LS1_15]
MVEAFHPAVRMWFERRFPAGPTAPQEAGWRAIADGADTLIAAPTGTGKTLAAFLVQIDRLYRAHEQGGLPDGTQVVYVSPLKALAVDIRNNLEEPLREIADVATELGLAAPDIRVAARTGDTASSERAAMLRHPPHILVTTPESLYLLVTSERSRRMLAETRSVIVDEIYAVAGNKRGSHLALTLERLSHIARSPEGEDGPQRVGLSATQRPIDVVARLLVGAGPRRSRQDGSPRCEIVDVGHQRQLDLTLELPDDELGAVASAEQMDQILDRIAAHVAEHRTTLVFVNTRRMAERVAHQLAERLGDDAVAAHHGSLSKDRRQRVEARLRAGDLRALVATASLELGIDIGPVELVCQLGSPRSLATFLQRVGRSNHASDGVPKGVLYPTTRDELVESAALLRGVRQGRLDAILVPRAPLDILAQQIVAECAAEEWSEDGLFALVRRASPFAELSRQDYDSVLDLVSEGIRTGRGKRAAYLHRDEVNGRLRARRGARMAALTSGGAIPESGDYRVVADPDGTVVGTVNEDWAVESMAGDVFLLGSTSWRIRRVEPGTVRVVDAQGAAPSVPFWLGEAPGRTAELSDEVSRIRSEVASRLDSGSHEAACRWLREECGIGVDAAETIVHYLAAAYASLGTLPTTDTIVLERFFDDSGGMQLVGHAPFGARLNRAFGLALRKRFCVNFDFELQAAASDNAILLSLGLEHSFPLEDVPGFLASATVEDVVRQAVLTAPMFAVRWRWNLNRSLAVPRMRGGKKNPPPIQRMEADDVMAAVFPTLAACQENVAPGPMEIPDQPLVRQTVYDCLHETMDVDGLAELVSGVESGRIRVVVRDTTEPSVLAHEILNGQPFTFLDDAPLEERRSRAVPLPRGLPVEPGDLATLDADAVERVRDEVRADPAGPDELHDLLMTVLGLPPEPAWSSWFDELVNQRRATIVDTGEFQLWTAVERRATLEVLFPDARVDPDLHATRSAVSLERDSAAAEMLRGHLDYRGPTTVGELSAVTGLATAVVAVGLARLEAEGFAFRGHFTSPDGPEEFCARRVLARAHAYTRRRLRHEIAPVTAQEFMRFLLRWQHVAPGARREGKLGVLAVVGQLQGYELAAGAWEEVLAARVEGYRPDWLDALCLSGEIAWGRLSPRGQAAEQAPRRSGMTPSKATPITLAVRDDLAWLLQAARGERGPAAPGPGRTRDVVDALGRHGALFPAQLASLTGRLPSEVDEALWDGLARGLVTADGFSALRALLSPMRTARPRGRKGLRRGGYAATARSTGRWSLMPDAVATDDQDELAEAVAEQLLARWGVVVRDVLARDTVGVPWREVLWALRRMEARGTVRGGRFVSGFTGEQFATPEAADLLRTMRKEPRGGETVRLPAADPLNLTGIVLPGPRVPAVPRESITYVDGVPPENGASEAAPGAS